MNHAHPLKPPRQFSQPSRRRPPSRCQKLHPGTARVRDLAERLHAHPGTARVRDLAERLHAHPGTARVRDLAEPITPAGTDPATLPPQPPPSHLWIAGPI